MAAIFFLFPIRLFWHNSHGHEEGEKGMDSWGKRMGSPTHPRNESEERIVGEDHGRGTPNRLEFDS